MTDDMFNNKKLNPIVTELIIRGRKLKIYLVFITQSYFAVPKDIKLNFTHYFITESLNKQELNDFVNLHLYKVYCKTIFFFSHFLL